LYDQMIYVAKTSMIHNLKTDLQLMVFATLASVTLELHQRRLPNDH